LIQYYFKQRRTDIESQGNSTNTCYSKYLGKVSVGLWKPFTKVERFERGKVGEEADMGEEQVNEVPVTQQFD